MPLMIPPRYSDHRVVSSFLIPIPPSLIGRFKRSDENGERIFSLILKHLSISYFIVLSRVVQNDFVNCGGM